MNIFTGNINNVMSKIGRRIKEIRTKRGLSQEQLAEAAKVNLRTIQRIENDETTPRGSTRRLIFDVLDIEIIEPEREPPSKYLIWSSCLALLAIVGSLLGWIRFTIGYNEFGLAIYNTFNGWSGTVRWGQLDFYNWLLSLCAISLGAVVIANAFGLIANKRRYVTIQLIFCFLYLIALVAYRYSVVFEIRPGLFITVVASILLMVAYRKQFLIDLVLSIFLIGSTGLLTMFFVVVTNDPPPIVQLMIMLVVVGFFIAMDFFIIRHFVRTRRIANNPVTDAR